MEDFDINDLQRKTDRFVISARELSSRGMSFIIVMLGVILQASHTALLMYDIAAFKQEWLKMTVGIGIGLFISSALAIFTLKHDGKNKDVSEIINIFFYFEIFTNVFYYFNSLIFSKGFDNATTQNWLYLIIAMPFSFIMPFAIKKFAGIISADERLKFGSIDTPDEQISNSVDFSDTEELLKQMEEMINIKNIEINNHVEKTYLKKGSNIELTIGEKKAVVSLGESPDDEEHEIIDEQEKYTI